VPRRFILWDIDGTLISTGRIGRLALESGAKRAGRLGVVPHVIMSGKTDPQIAREILTASGMAEADIAVVLPAALEEAERVLLAESGRMLAEGRAHPGVRELLEALAATDGVRQSLLTGNTAPNALEKVRTFGFEPYFDFKIGAYGTDHPNRDCLVPIALERARELRGADYRREEVWVIGDTARDLSCARAAGVRCLIVGTGHNGFEAVRKLEADALAVDLANTEEILRILLS
jgi:phosphoglycolate phosphatase-like HAD superfamily hydrolase